MKERRTMYICKRQIFHAFREVLYVMREITKAGRKSVTKFKLVGPWEILSLEVKQVFFKDSLFTFLRCFGLTSHVYNKYFKNVVCPVYDVYCVTSLIA